MAAAAHARPVVTDLRLCFHSSTNASTGTEPDGQRWHRIEKELYLHTHKHRAWLYVVLVDENMLGTDDLLVVDIRVGEPPSRRSDYDRPWERRPGDVWLLRRAFAGKLEEAVTAVDVLFGGDACDPRPQWCITQSPLQLNGPPGTPVAWLSVCRGRPKPVSTSRVPLRVKQNGRFKIVQISDTHMVTGVGRCTDAIDAAGNDLPPSEADPLTVILIEHILDVEIPDLVVLTGDQLHHDIHYSQSALFKVAAPMIRRSIPFAAVFGNHDSEGIHALSRAAQIAILQDLPFSLCEPGPEDVDGTGNFYHDILAPAPSQLSLASLYFLDSHSEKQDQSQVSEYDPITQSQIDWFTRTCRAQRSSRKDHDGNEPFHLSLVFQHIPLPEFGNCDLRIRSGSRREPTEGPRTNTHFYDALAKEGVSALGCGHDHVNDFCALLPCLSASERRTPVQIGPWLCYGGTAGYGGYCSYGRQRFHRRARVWEIEPEAGRLTTWTRVEYTAGKFDEVVLVDNGEVVDLPEDCSNTTT